MTSWSQGETKLGPVARLERQWPGRNSWFIFGSLFLGLSKIEKKGGGITRLQGVFNTLL